MLGPSKRTLRYGLSSTMEIPCSTARSTSAVPPLERHRDAGRVVKVGDVVDELRRWRRRSSRIARARSASSRTSRPSLILADLDESHAEAAEDRDRGEIGRRGDHDRVALVEQQPADELDGVLRAVRHQHLLAA